MYIFSKSKLFNHKRIFSDTVNIEQIELKDRIFGLKLMIHGDIKYCNTIMKLS